MWQCCGITKAPPPPHCNSKNRNISYDIFHKYSIFLFDANWTAHQLQPNVVFAHICTSLLYYFLSALLMVNRWQRWWSFSFSPGFGASCYYCLACQGRAEWINGVTVSLYNCVSKQNSMKVMFKCLWKNCGKVLSTAAGIQRHIRTIHLG